MWTFGSVGAALAVMAVGVAISWWLALRVAREAAWRRPAAAPAAPAAHKPPKPPTRTVLGVLVEEPCGRLDLAIV